MWSTGICKSKWMIFSNVFKFNKHYSIISSIFVKPIIGEVKDIKGWIKNIREQKEYIFADINDGSCAKKLQIVIPKKLYTSTLSIGSSVHITGKLTKNQRGQLEVLAEAINIIGNCVVTDGYPFIPRTIHPPEYIRQYLHFRSRTNYISAILRVRNAVTRYIHDYFYSENYFLVNTPILTSNDCEGAGELFKILPNDVNTMESMMQEVKCKNSDSVYFGSKTFLTVSGQLHLEAVCRGLGNVYTLGPAFRAENSQSRLHLSEFYMLEAEMAFCDNIEQLQILIENLLKYVFDKTFNSNEEDIHLIDKKRCKPLWLDKRIITLSYDEASDILEKKGLKTTERSLSKEQELALIEYCGSPVFVIRWPKNLKSFYMKECADDSTKVDALDLLMPMTGEVVGGSLREDDYNKLKLKLPSDKLKWYLELRKFGNIPTGGFGLGLERLLQVLCGVSNIKDTLPFPRWPHHCSM